MQSAFAILLPAARHAIGRIRYWYQFNVGGEWSAVGRTRTTPAPGQSPRRLRFAFASCQHFEQGLYTAYQHMVTEDLDMVLHLGDYIYEDGVSPTLPRQHDGDEPMTLAQYRNRHALYKSDTYLQSTHGAFPWLVVFDDHEVENNWASDFDQNGTAPDLFLPRRTVARTEPTSTVPRRSTRLERSPAGSRSGGSSVNWTTRERAGT